MIGQLSKSKGHVPTERSYIYHKEYSCENQSSSTQCLKVRSKVKASDRFTEWKKDGMTEWQTAVNIDSCSILKKNQAFPLKVFPKVWSKQHFYLCFVSKNIQKR